MNELFDITNTIILTGDTNKGKTSTLNTLLSVATDRNINFITENKINTTKGCTVVKFHSDNKYKIDYKNESNEYENIEELIQRYNKVTSEINIFFDNIITIYISTPIITLHNITIIDCVGKTLENNNYYTKQLEYIDNNFPNNIKVFVTTELSVEICEKYKFILLTYADEIDERKKNDNIQYKSLFKNNNINYISNIDTNIENIVLDTESISVYTKKNNNIKELWDILNGKIEEQKFKISKEDIYNELENKCFDSKENLLQIIRKSNDKNIYNYFNSLYDNKKIIDNNKLNEKTSEFLKIIDLLKKDYNSFRIGNHCVNALKILKQNIKSIFGIEYVETDYKEVITKYKTDIEKKYKELLIQVLFLNDNHKRKRD